MPPRGLRSAAEGDARSLRSLRNPAQVRPATAEDGPGIGAVHMQSWRDTYARLLPPGALDGVSATESGGRWADTIRAGRLDVRVAERDGRVVGYAAAGDPESAEPRPLQLYGLYIDLAEYGTGTGQALLAAAVGDRPALLWVADDNPRARAFYTRNGFSPDGQRDTHTLAGHPIEAVRMVR